MNTLAADAPNRRPRPDAEHDPGSPAIASRPTASALWISGGVAALALLSFFVHVTDEPTQRAQLQLQAQLQAVTRVDFFLQGPLPAAKQRLVQTAAH